MNDTMRAGLILALAYPYAVTVVYAAGSAISAIIEALA